MKFDENIVEWEVGEGDIEVTTHSKNKYYVSNEGLVWGGSREIRVEDAVELYSTHFFKDQGLATTKGVFIGGRMLTQNPSYPDSIGKALITSVVKEIRKRSD